MKYHAQFLLLGLLSVNLLVGCGGGNDPPILDKKSTDNTSTTGGGTTGGGTTGGGSTSASGISYVPLAVFEAYTEFSGYPSNSLFQGDGESPLIKRNLINPIDAATMLTVSTAVADDYKVTVDGVEIDASESFPLLQHVIGSETRLRTALVFDLSNSVSQIDINALITEAKDYIAACQASADPAISSQEFVVWGFAERIQEVTSGFTSNTGTINAALDGIATLYGNKNLGVSSNLHQAIVQSIGRFDGSENGVTYSFLDDGSTGNDDNDLIDRAATDGIYLSQLVVFSSGPDTALGFSQGTMVRAIESQSFLKYDVAAGASSGTMKNLKKPLFYYVVGRTTAGRVYSALSAQAEKTTSLLLSGGAYEFSSALIADQQAAINARIDLDNQYLFRFAFLPRIGDHTTIFTSTNATGFSYSLTSQYADADISGVAGLAPKVEITGPNGEYIVCTNCYSSGAYPKERRLSSITLPFTLRPATRWTPDVYAAGDYAWSVISGGVSGTANVDGSYTINSITSSPATLQLTNNVLGDYEQIVLFN